MSVRALPTPTSQLLVAFVVVMGSPALAQESLWRIQTSDDGTVVATVALSHTGNTGEVVSTLLNIGFSDKTLCRRMEFGVGLLRGSGYGNPIGKISPPRTEPIDFNVDGRSAETPLPYLVKYDNGLEATFAATPAISQALTYGRVAIAQIVSGTPKLEFPIYGAGTAIAEAQRRCISGM